MLAYGMDDIAIFLRVLQRVDELATNVVAERQLASCRAIDQLGMLGLQQDERYRIGGKQVEIFRGHEAQPPEERPLRHDVDPSRAHGRDDLAIRHRGSHPELGVAEAARMDAERPLLPNTGCAARGMSPLDP